MLYRSDTPRRNLGSVCVEGESDKKTKLWTDGVWFGVDHAKGTKGMGAEMISEGIWMR